MLPRELTLVLQRGQNAGRSHIMKTAADIVRRAREIREKAGHARRLAAGQTGDVQEGLLAYAQELDGEAALLEREAEELEKGCPRT
jgi:hypothetical protein